MHRHLRLPLLLLFALLLNGCKVNYSFTGADIPAGAKTLSVEVFEARAPCPHHAPRRSSQKRCAICSKPKPR